MRDRNWHLSSQATCLCRLCLGEQNLISAWIPFRSYFTFTRGKVFLCLPGHVSQPPTGTGKIMSWSIFNNEYKSPTMMDEVWELKSVNHFPVSFMLLWPWLSSDHSFIWYKLRAQAWRFWKTEEKGCQLGTDKTEVRGQRQEQAVDHEFRCMRWKLRSNPSLGFWDPTWEVLRASRQEGGTQHQWAKNMAHRDLTLKHVTDPAMGFLLTSCWDKK